MLILKIIIIVVPKVATHRTLQFQLAEAIRLAKKKRKKSKDKTAPAKILVSSRNFSKTYPYSLVKLVNIIF